MCAILVIQTTLLFWINFFKELTTDEFATNYFDSYIADKEYMAVNVIFCSILMI